MRVGLVLSGGGAKGAYQVGVVQALAGAGVEVCTVSGASIGSLNGAIIASSESMSQAAERLEQVWQAATESSPIEMNHAVYARYIAMLAAAGLGGAGPIAMRFASVLMSGEALRRAGFSKEEVGVIDDSHLRRLLERFLDPSYLTDACPFYVSLYPHISNIDAMLNLLKGELLGRFDTRQSEFKLMQELPVEMRHEALMASAAIPVAFRARYVDEQLYSDGGQGDYRSAQGNTPITPLLGQGLDLIVVSHLSDGGLWDCNDFPGENILELRPRARLSNSAMDMLGFEEEKMRNWMVQGREDTEQCLASVLRIAGARAELSSAENRVKNLSEGLESSGLEKIMDQLKEP